MAALRFLGRRLNNIASRIASQSKTKENGKELTKSSTLVGGASSWSKNVVTAAACPLSKTTTPPPPALLGRSRMSTPGTSLVRRFYGILLIITFLVSGGVDAAFAPADHAALRTAVNECLGEAGGDGSCPDFSASNDETGHPHAVMGEWDISKVTSIKNLFHNQQNFNADLSKWNTEGVTTMQQSKRTVHPRRLCPFVFVFNLFSILFFYFFLKCTSPT